MAFVRPPPPPPASTTALTVLQKAPEGPPPGYPQQAHFDAGPVDPRSQNYYGSPPPQQYGSPSPYGQPGPYQQGPYGPPPGPGYGPQYQQQPILRWDIMMIGEEVEERREGYARG
ncbi:uncharacterized protein LTR77_006102 [Saxophila tyrrhenica]|uniref:Uncharacterized protein n=1 Tax=Saxophila tyrrhenica TaxID=1690608 RepID=A0AAV9P7E2_9PEZI|nr:hypothetical protein LTR77_006102 [Saxophila tyrrhenica]